MNAARLVHVGLGPIGRGLLELTLERGLLPVAAADLDPQLAGRDLGGLLDTPLELGVPIVCELERALAAGADVALVATSSHLPELAATAEACLAAGCHVVSTCEELAWPWQRHPELARRLDGAARRAGRVLIGTGINPGFLMDFLPLALGGLCRRIRAVRVRRIQDASRRRLPFQLKVGAGMTPEAFRARMGSDAPIGHVGLAESIALLAGGLGWALERFEESLEPLIAERPVSSPQIAVAAGQVRGVRQLGRGWVAGRARIELEFVAGLGQPDPHEAIEIDAEPPLAWRAESVHGDHATAAVVVGLAGRLAAGGLAPGLRTMADFAPHAGIPLAPDRD